MSEIHHKYKKNYLSDVIFRIDFPAISDLLNIPNQFKETIKEHYPIAEQINQLGFVLNNSLPDGIQKAEKSIWRFKTEDSQQIIEIEPESLVINFKKYKDFDLFKEEVYRVVNIFFDIYKITSVTRIGLRYIDQIVFPEESDPFDWANYINNTLIQSLNFVDDKKLLRRSMQRMEIFLEDNIILVFNFGIFNSLYPNRVLNKEFILDYDCSVTGLIEKNEIFDKLSKFSDINSQYFEKSITKQMGTHLNE